MIVHRITGHIFFSKNHREPRALHKVKPKQHSHVYRIRMEFDETEDGGRQSSFVIFFIFAKMLARSPKFLTII